VRVKVRVGGCGRSVNRQELSIRQALRNGILIIGQGVTGLGRHDELGVWHGKACIVDLQMDMADSAKILTGIHGVELVGTLLVHWDEAAQCDVACGIEIRPAAPIGMAIAFIVGVPNFDFGIAQRLGRTGTPPCRRGTRR